MVNHYYFYCVDREFGPFFINFPYNAKEQGKNNFGEDLKMLPPALCRWSGN